MTTRLCHGVLSKETLELLRREACENSHARLALCIAYAERTDTDPEWYGLADDALEATEHLLTLARHKVRKCRADIRESCSRVETGHIDAYTDEVLEELELAVRTLKELSEACIVRRHAEERDAEAGVQ